MDDAACVREFERLAERLGIEIRTGSDTPSGLCVVKGKKILFVPKELNTEGKLAVFARAFRGLDLDGIFIVPTLRRYIGIKDARSDW